MKRTKFGEAFAEARKAGKKTFEFGGKSYTTETKEEKAGATAKKATRSFAANAVPGRRQAKPKPSGGGSVATPSRGPSKERRGAGAIGRGGKDPVAPRDMRGVNQTPITGKDIAKSMATGALKGAAMAGGAGAARAGARAAGSAATKGVVKAAKKMFPKKGDVLARTRPGEVEGPVRIMRPKAKAKAKAK